jgi:hypothetical protein
MGKKRVSYNISVEKPEERNHMGYRSVGKCKM